MPYQLNKFSKARLDRIYQAICDRHGISSQQLTQFLGLTDRNPGRLQTNLITLQEIGKIKYVDYRYHPTDTSRSS